LNHMIKLQFGGYRFFGIETLNQESGISNLHFVHRLDKRLFSVSH